MKKLLMGVDFGTGGCKATVIDTEGTTFVSAFEEYPSEHLRPGWSEQDPATWIKAFNNTVRSCLKGKDLRAEEIAGIGISASTHNGVLLDTHDQVIRPCIMWNDQRSAPQVKELTKKYGERIYAIGMQMPTATWTLPQLLWIRENDQESFKKIHRILFTKDYVRQYVTGDFSTDHVDAQGSLLYDARKKEWSAELCGMIGLDPACMPPIVGTKHIAGTVRREVAEATGLREGTPVITGCSDTAAEDYGSGAVEEGQLLVKMATAGNVNMIFNDAHPHPKAYTYPYAVEGMWYMVTGTNASASSYRWLRDSLYGTEKRRCEEAGEDVYQLMDADAAQAPVGSRGLIFHPYILGERCPYFNANARADFFGISVVHDKKYFARAVLEGVAYSLYDCFHVVRENGGNANEIRLIGGGAKSPLWCQIICDVFGISVIRPEKDDSSFGDALLAGVGVGLFEHEIAAVRQCNRIKKTYQPNQENHKKYEEFFGIYREVTAASSPIWEKLQTLAHE
jgi:xylulokinase